MYHGRKQNFVLLIFSSLSSEKVKSNGVYNPKESSSILCPFIENNPFSETLFVPLSPVPCLNVIGLSYPKLYATEVVQCLNT